MHKNFCLTMISLALPMVACQQPEEQTDPPVVLGGSPKVIYSQWARKAFLSRNDSQSQLLELTKILNNKALLVDLNDLSIKEVDDNPKERNPILRHFDRPIESIEVTDTEEGGGWRVEFQGKFVEHQEFNTQGEGLIPTKITPIKKRRFTGNVVLIIKNTPLIREYFKNAIIDSSYPFRFSYNYEKGIVLFQYFKDDHGNSKDSSQIYLFKVTPGNAPVSSTEPSNPPVGLRAVTNVPNKEKR